MINKIIEAIADHIKKRFENINVYTEKVKQGFESPCFSIICSSWEKNLYRGHRYRLQTDIEVHYYNGKERENYNDIMTEIFEVINYIKLDDCCLRPIKMKADTGEDYCIFTAGYDFFCYEKEEKEMMGEYMEKISVKNG